MKSGSPPQATWLQVISFQIIVWYLRFIECEVAQSYSRTSNSNTNVNTQKLKRCLRFLPQNDNVWMKPVWKIAFKPVWKIAFELVLYFQTSVPPKNGLLSSPLFHGFSFTPKDLHPLWKEWQGSGSPAEWPLYTSWKTGLKVSSPWRRVY